MHEQGTDSESTQQVPVSSYPLDKGTSELLLRIYLQKRIEGQLGFYRSRIREFDSNSGFMVGIGAMIMALSSMISAIGASSSDPKLSPLLALITALLPAMAALIASFRQLYQWEKQASLYRDAALGLQQANLIMPDDDVFDDRTAPLILPRLVTATEEVFIAEINQWGQIALGADGEDDDELNSMLRRLHTQDQTASNSTSSPPPPSS